MTHITTETLERLATLSALELTSDEAAGLTTDIESILGYVDQLGELDTDGVTPTYQVTDLQNVWRNDEVDTALPSRDTLLATAGDNVSNNQIKVPKVL